MARATNAPATRARKKKYFKIARGYWGRRKNVWTVTKNAVEKAWCYAYRDRKVKKRSFRTLWIQRINAGVRAEGMSYSVFMSRLGKHGIELNRKVLADLAMNEPAVFRAIVQKVS